MPGSTPVYTSLASHVFCRAATLFSGAFERGRSRLTGRTSMPCSWIRSSRTSCEGPRSFEVFLSRPNYTPSMRRTISSLISTLWTRTHHWPKVSLQSVFTGSNDLHESFNPPALGLVVRANLSTCSTPSAPAPLSASTGIGCNDVSRPWWCDRA